MQLRIDAEVGYGQECFGNVDKAYPSEPPGRQPPRLTRDPNGGLRGEERLQERMNPIRHIEWFQRLP